MPKKTKRAQARRTQTKPVVYKVMPLSPFAAFIAISGHAKRLSQTAFSYSDGLGTYTLIVGEGAVKLECRVGGVVIYAHTLGLAHMRPENIDRIAALRAMPVNATATPRSRNNRADPVRKLRVGNETANEVAAVRNFRQATRSQVHVMSRKACDDMAFGRVPGHIGDLK